MTSEHLVLCVGTPGDLLNLRKQVVETTGATVFLAHDLHTACEAATAYRFCAAIIGAEFGTEGQAVIGAALRVRQDRIAVLNLQGVTAAHTLVAFVAGLIGTDGPQTLPPNAGTAKALTAS